jgi:hypothetical protein
MTDTTRLARSARDLPLEPGGEVAILLTSSGVRLRGVDGDRVTVRTRDGADIDAEVVMDSSPGRVQVRDAERGVRFGPLRMQTHGGADLEIEIPRTARLSFRTLSGDVDAVDIGPESRWSSASGDLRLVVGSGRHTVDSMSGDVTIEATGTIALRARSVSGDLRIHAPRIDDLGATTTSGDIRIEADLASASEHQVTSVSGDVELVTPSPVRIETQTIAGDVRASGTHTAEGGRGRRTIVVGDGSVRVSVRTTSGDIRLRGRGDTALPVAPEPPIAAEPPIAPQPPISPVPPVAPEPLDATYVVAEAEAAPNLVRPAAADDPAEVRARDPEPDPVGPDGEPAAASASGPWLGAESTTDRREAARLDILRALERGELDIDAASHRLEQLEDAGPRSFRGWC